ncbi:alanine racemase [Hirschia baltica]|uniref:Alanine racemase n=1 Tax=Hirschia baltica (strain ATCC 49814 / DSM 5838 / IFAM 1418) TaxID=582402 RepID=C6XKR2_HIRBI|nr:alanine racemase [Hirschia baltica]ACT59629.1 alanine racemase [Hirschia baltica ATCC 49814]
MTLTMTSANIPSSSPAAIVHLQNVVNNWKELARLSGAADTGAVVKANAYGLGAEQVASTLYEAGCRTFFVAHIDEAIQIRKTLGNLALVFIFHGIQADNVDDVIAHDIVPVLNSTDQVELWIRSGAPFPAALHVDTGMNRLGLQLKELANVKKRLPANRIGWVMSHLACADIPEHPMNARQLALFEKVAAIWPHAEKSLSNTAGICLGSKYTFDLTRPGIGLYGGYSRKGVFTPSHCVTLSAPILSIIEPDASNENTIGYGATSKVTNGQRLATIALGYADGALRSLSNSGFVFVNGVPCSIVGRVSMDLITIDITNAPTRTTVLDRVEFLGQHASVEIQARAASTASYELLTSMGERIPRVYEHPIQTA